MTYDLEEWFEIEKKLRSGQRLDKKQKKIVTYIVDNLDINIAEPKGKKYYRARPIEKLDAIRQGIFSGFNKDKSMAPRPSQVKEMGRFNKENEAVLYLAEEKYTALAEQRPGKKTSVSIAEVALSESVRLADFSYDGAVIDDEDDLHSIYHWMALACYMVVHIDRDKYLVTQFIAKKLRELGYDGIKYSSSVSANGRNIVLFDPQKAKAVSSKVYQTHAVIYFSKESLPGDGEVLMPNALGQQSKEEISAFLNGILGK